jgi:general secretion pathway protein K
MLVLWVIIVLGAVAVGVVSASRAQTDLVDTVRSRTVARYAAESGVAAAAAFLKEMYGAAETAEEQARVFADFQSEIESWGVRPLGTARYQVAVLDLNSRIDLNNSDADLLFGLFRQFVGESKATALLDALEDWKDEDDEPLPNGAEAADYARAGSPYRPTNRPLMRLDELAWIQGFDSIAEVLAPYVTVWGDGRVNVNTGDAHVLAAVPEIGEVGAEALISSRRQGGVLPSKIAVFSRLAELNVRTLSAQLSSVAMFPGRVLIISRGWEEGRPVTHEIQAVHDLRLGGIIAPGTTLQIRYWLERDL